MAKIPIFEVQSLTLLQNAGALLAYASVSLAGGLLTIHECRVVRLPGQPAQVLLPQKSFLDENGIRRYSTLIEFSSREWRAALTQAVLTAWNDHPSGIRPLDRLQQRPPSFGDAVRERAGIGPQPSQTHPVQNKRRV